MASIPRLSKSTKSSRRWLNKRESFKICAPKLRAIGTTLSLTWWKTLAVKSSVKATILSMRTENRLSRQRIYRGCRNRSANWFLTINLGPILLLCASNTWLLSRWSQPLSSITSTMRTETYSRSRLMTCDALYLRRYSLIGWMILT